MRAGRKLLFDNLDKARGRTAVYVHARIQILNRTRIGSRARGEIRSEHTHLARTGAIDSSASTGDDHADNGNVERLLAQAQGCRRCRIAGDNDDLDVMARKPTPCLQGK